MTDNYCKMKPTVLIFLIIAVYSCDCLPQNFRYGLQRKYSTSKFDFPLQRRGENQARIINGKEAKPHQFPYQVALNISTLYSTGLCGGVLVKGKYVLTSAACIDNSLQVEVILGAHNLDEDESSQIRIISSDYTVHERWSSSTMEHDIAVVFLNEEVSDSSNIRSASLPKSDVNVDGEDGIISGWGITSDDSINPSSVLRYVSSKVISNDQCKSTEDLGSLIKSTNVCFSGSNNVGACIGDSGGPLVVDDVLVGIISFEYKYCETNHPTVLTRISKYLDWIDANCK